MYRVYVNGLLNVLSYHCYAVLFRVSKKCYIHGEQHVVSPFSIVFPGCLTRHVINAARIVLFESTINLNNFSSDKKHNV